MNDPLRVSVRRNEKSTTLFRSLKKSDNQPDFESEIFDDGGLLGNLTRQGNRHSRSKTPVNDDSDDSTRQCSHQSRFETPVNDDSDDVTRQGSRRS